LKEINDNPARISNLTPFGLSDKELDTLKKYLEDEQRNRSRKEGQDSQGGDRLDQDKSQGREEDISGSTQGDTIHDRPEEGGRQEVKQPPSLNLPERFLRRSPGR